MAFRFAAATNKEISQIIKQAVPEIHEAFFMELGIEAKLNERFTTLLIIGSKSSI